MGTDLLCRFDPIHLSLQDNVHEHQIRAFVFGYPKGALSRRGNPCNRIPKLCQAGFYAFGHNAVIFDD